MATFTVNEKEYELKLTYKAIKRLNNAYEGGSYELIGKAIQGDFDSFPTIVHAALLHTGENFSLKTIESEIEKLVDNEQIAMEDVAKISDAVVTQSFFYKTTVDKLMAANPEMKKALDQLRG